ncbi:hypothetical protein G6F57_023413 [Rhizopus arrhizus]|nr:hypothetical protein G6F68_021665 [Rhizopus microsporus]KAG1425001.1 hypothetical protein G6F57_023413 [Rhizopus arrhizus]
MLTSTTFSNWADLSWFPYSTRPTMAMMNSSSKPKPAPSRDPTRRLRKASISIPLIMAVRSMAAQARETLWEFIFGTIQ